MRKISEMKTIGDLFGAISFVLGIVALICYAVSGTDKSEMTDTFVSAMVIVPLCIAFVLNGIALFFPISYVKMGAFAMYFLTILLWAVNQAGYLVNVVMGTDGNTFSFAYIFAAVCMIICFVLSLLTLFKFSKREFIGKKEN